SKRKLRKKLLHWRHAATYVLHIKPFEASVPYDVRVLSHDFVFCIYETHHTEDVSLRPLCPYVRVFYSSAVPGGGC
uniref:Ovule protein n=1 Tax=Parascaris univalens TaxID=6257 RepID=A0A915C573_PARUN